MFPPHAIADDHGDNTATATSVTVGSVTAGVIDVAGDIDFFRFTVSEAAKYVFFSRDAVDNTGVLRQPDLLFTLYNSSLGVVKQGLGGGEGSNFRQELYLIAGTYYIAVKGDYTYAGWNHAYHGPYEIHIEGPGAPTTTDEHGFSWYSATPVTVGSVTTGTIDLKGDGDYFRLTVTRAAKYVFFSRNVVDNTGTLQHVNLLFTLYDNNYLYTGSSTPIKSEPFWGEDLNFRQELYLNPGTYYIAVKGDYTYAGWNYAYHGPYEIHIEGPGAPTPSDEHGFSWYSATPVTVGSVTTGTIDLKGDGDYFRLTVTQAAKYVFFSRNVVDNTGTLQHVNLLFTLYDNNYLYTGSSTPIKSEPFWGEDLNFRQELYLNPGTYYIAVKGDHTYAGWNYAYHGPYEIHIEGPGAPTPSDEHGFSWYSATPVTVGSVTTGTIDLKGDGDYFRLTVTRAAKYVFFSRNVVDNTGTLQHVNLLFTLYDNNYLYTGSSTPIKSEAFWGEDLNFRQELYLNPGTYYIAVKGDHTYAGWNYAYHGPYEIHIEGPGAPTPSDEHGFSWYSATPVTVGSVTPGKIDLKGDLDYVTFTVNATDNYLIYSRDAVDNNGVLQHADLLGTLSNSLYENIKQGVGGGEGNNFKLRWLLTPGRYYLQVQGDYTYAGWPHTYHGPYNLHIHPDCGSSATNLSITGVVSDAFTGLPLAGVTVELENGAKVITGPSGAYSFGSLATGSYRITYTLNAYAHTYRVVSLCSTNASVPVRLTSISNLFGICTQSGYAADPVNTSTGNYTFQRRDLEIPGIGLPFALERGYNSQDNTAGPLGWGWTHSFAPRLTASPDNTVTVRWGDGKTETWSPDGTGGYRPPVGVFDNLVKIGDGTFTVLKKTRAGYRFDATGRLLGVTDRNGNSIVLTYSGSLLSFVTDTAGRQISFTYDGSGRITQISDPIGRTVRYAYDTNGDLASSTDPDGNVTTYTYDASRQLLTVVDPRGNTIVTNTYDNQKRVVTSQRDAKGGQTSYAYDPQARRTAITNALGEVSYHDYDDRLRLTQATDAAGNPTAYTYDAAGSRTEVRDKNGNVTRYAYDARGNVVSKSDPLGNATTLTYDAGDNPLSRRDALGNTTNFEYDATGNLTRTTDPLGHATSISYAPSGLPVSVTDSNGKTTSLEYDGDGNLVRTTNPLGGVTSATYDDVGRRLLATDALGRITSFAWDNVGNLLAATDALGNAAAGSYDGNGNRLTATDPMGHVTSFAYDVKDLLTSVTDALGKTATTSYDALDRKAGVADRKGNAAQFAYDVAGNMVRATDAQGQVSTFTYDRNGNRLMETDPSGSTMTYVYDALNRVTSRTDALGNRESTTYDNVGRVVSATNAKSQITRMEYAAAGRLTKVTDPAGGTVHYAYDNVGNRTSMTEPNGHLTTYEYDGLNRQIRRTEPLGNVTAYIYDAVGNLTSRTNANGNTTTYTYDALNRLTRIGYSDSTTVTFAYDRNGNRAQMVDGIGTSTYAYDALNRMTSAQDGFGKTLAYAYDFNGNITTLTYPDGKAVSYAYDALNRMSTVTDWQSRTTTYSYDTVSRLIRAQNPNGTRAEYGYDAGGRLTQLANRKSDSSVISTYTYTLDALGNHLQVNQTEPLEPVLTPKNIAYAYDAENRLLNAGSTAFTYDKNGNMVAKGADTYTYDPADRLIQSTISGITTTYRYNGAGRRMERTEGTAKRYVVDINRPLPTVLAETDGSGSIMAYYVHGLGLVSRVGSDGSIRYYHFDSRGSTVALSDASQSVTDKYAYDPFGKVVNSEGTNPNPFRYVGRYGVADDGNGLLYMRARHYASDLGMFLGKDPIYPEIGQKSDRNLYLYASGNPVINIDPLGLWSVETLSVVLQQSAISSYYAFRAVVSAVATGAQLGLLGPSFITFAGGFSAAIDYGNKASQYATAAGANIVNAYRNKEAVPAENFEGMYDVMMFNSMPAAEDALKIMRIAGLAKSLNDIVGNGLDLITGPFLRENLDIVDKIDGLLGIYKYLTVEEGIYNLVFKDVMSLMLSTRTIIIKNDDSLVYTPLQMESPDISSPNRYKK